MSSLVARAGGLFNGLSGESESSTDYGFEFDESRVLDIAGVYDADVKDLGAINVIDLYRGLLPNDLSVGDVYGLSLVMDEDFFNDREKNCLGCFITSCVEGCVDNRVFWRPSLDRDIPLLGRYLRGGKELVILGDAGDFAGDRLNGGSLLIEGNAGIDLGYEMSGLIRVMGDVKRLHFMMGRGDVFVGGVQVVREGRIVVRDGGLL